MQSYLDLLGHVLEHGESHDDRTGVGTTSVFGYQWRHSMKEGFPLVTTKRVTMRWVAEELFWFLSGSTNAKDLQAKGVTIWDEWSTKEQCEKFGREEGMLGHIYGGLWRNFLKLAWNTSANSMFGNDQIIALIDDIKNSPNSRRLIVSGWHPIEQRKVSLPPCHTLWQVKCHEKANEISLNLYARSIDAFLGLPYNIASYALLLSIIAHVTDRVPRDLIISFGDLHIYNTHINAVETQLQRSPMKLPTLEINDTTKDIFSIGWDDIFLQDYKHHPKIAAPVAI